MRSEKDKIKFSQELDKFMRTLRRAQSDRNKAGAAAVTKMFGTDKHVSELEAYAFAYHGAPVQPIQVFDKAINELRNDLFKKDKELHQKFLLAIEGDPAWKQANTAVDEHQETRKMMEAEIKRMIEAESQQSKKEKEAEFQKSMNPAEQWLFEEFMTDLEDKGQVEDSDDSIDTNDPRYEDWLKKSTDGQEALSKAKEKFLLSKFSDEVKDESDNDVIINADSLMYKRWLEQGNGSDALREWKELRREKSGRTEAPSATKPRQAFWKKGK